MSTFSGNQDASGGSQASPDSTIENRVATLAAKVTEIEENMRLLLL